jgi:lycopene cyclase domain-containing protein
LVEVVGMANQKNVILLISGIIILSSMMLYGLSNHFMYFGLLIAVFFIPSLLLWYHIQLHADRWEKVSLTVVLVISFFFSVIIEVVAVYLKFWTFFTDDDPLLGINIGDIPLEEFIFYFGANMQLCFLYLAVSLKCESLGITPAYFRSWFKNRNSSGKNGIFVDDGKKVLLALGIIAAILATVGLVVRAEKDHPVPDVPKKFRNSRSRPVYIEGVWYPGWLIAIIPFLTIGIAWFRSVLKKVNIVAFFISLMINLTMYVLFEYNAIMRGHWVYNEQRLLGWRFAGTIPLEQIILYFVSFLFLVPFFESVRFFLIALAGSSEEKKVYEEETGVCLSNPVSQSG